MQNPNQPNEIIPGIYLGNELSANEKTLSERGIDYVLNVKHYCSLPTHIRYYLHVNMSDYGETDLKTVFPKCFAFISEARSKEKKILIHCAGGVNRSPTIMIGYLMAVEGWTLRKAFDHVKQCRKATSPHELYWSQLVAYERELTGTNTMKEDSFESVQQYLRKVREQANKEREAQEAKKLEAQLKRLRMKEEWMAKNAASLMMAKGEGGSD
eukprot:TRINITY_DN842_c2_g1_i1.p1 TRINITY_DN842_c2_g1~~TRINITY_DN842_c2_g1_i1.p1  ORF type:complete len:212 (-),score=37.55 TRINITY_DN842_c2_g1_i1:350-985(-)